MAESNYVVEENQRPKSKKQTMEKTKEKAKKEKGGGGGKLAQVIRKVKGSIKAAMNTFNGTWAGELMAR